jgi:hypothetical protein
MRDELSFAASQLEQEFGVVPRIRGSLACAIKRRQLCHLNSVLRFVFTNV